MTMVILACLHVLYYVYGSTWMAIYAPRGEMLLRTPVLGSVRLGYLFRCLPLLSCCGGLPRPILTKTPLWPIQSSSRCRWCASVPVHVARTISRGVVRFSRSFFLVRDWSSVSRLLMLAFHRAISSFSECHCSRSCRWNRRSHRISQMRYALSDVIMHRSLDCPA